MRTSGFDFAGSVRAGTVIEEVYCTAPGTAPVIGEEYATMADALAAAIADARDAERRHDGFRARPVVDVRWKMRHPVGGSTDTVAERFTYDSVDDAGEHLARIKRLA